MSKLSLRKIKNQSDINIDFTCGLSYIDEYIKNAYYPNICGHEYLYCCYENDEIVGYCSISIREVEDKYIERVSKDYYSDDTRYFATFYIRYIAVDINKQNNKIGTKFLKMIILYMKNYIKSFPVRFIILEALKDKIDWYEKIGFQIIDKEEKNDNKKMYYDLFGEEEYKIINEYASI